MFSIDFAALLILIAMSGLFYLIWQWGNKFYPPHLLFSNLTTLKSVKSGGEFKLSSKLMLAALTFFGIAFVDPHYFVKKEVEEKQPPPVKQINIPTEGVAIYLVLDQSGSMSQEVKAHNLQGKWILMTKMDLLKQVTKQFVEGGGSSQLAGRPNDMLGLVAFARSAQVLVPLTLDHQSILKELEKLNFTSDLEQDGTAIGYAIFKTANLIAATRHYAQDLAGEEIPAYEIKSSVIIVVTDGFQAPNPLDKDSRHRNIELIDAANYAKANDIKLYVINVEPRIATQEFAVHRNMMKKIAELTGGQFYIVDSSMGLDKIYSEIDRLEKSKLPIETRFVTPPKSQLPQLYDRVSFYPYLIALGMVCMGIAVLFEGVFMRRIP